MKRFCIVNGSGKRLVYFNSKLLTEKPKKVFKFTDKKKGFLLWDRQIQAQSFIYWIRYICAIHGYRRGNNLKVGKY